MFVLWLLLLCCLLLSLVDVVVCCWLCVFACWLALLCLARYGCSLLAVLWLLLRVVVRLLYACCCDLLVLYLGLF